MTAWPRSPQFQLRAVTNEVTLKPAKASLIQIGSGGLNRLTLTGAGVQLTASHVRIDLKRTPHQGPEKGLRQAGVGSLVVEPLPNSQADTRPEYHLEFSPPDRTEVELHPRNEGLRKIQMVWHPAREGGGELRISPEAVGSVKVTTTRFLLTVRYCRVKFRHFKGVEDSDGLFLTVAGTISLGIDNAIEFTRTGDGSGENVLDMAFQKSSGIVGGADGWP